MMLTYFKIEAQVDIATHNYTGGFHAGWNTANNLDFKIGLTTPTPLMTLTTTGDLNIFNATTSPANKTAYQIGGNNILWHNGNTTDIFVGVNAGSGSITGNHKNTIMGNTAGISLTSGYNNVAVGFEALYSGTTTYGAVAVGFHAAKYTTTGCGVIAIGEESTRQNTTGNYNIGIGVGALKGNVTGNYNICIGWDAGGGAYTGPFYSHNNNSCLGTYAGKFLKNGSNNVFMGHSSGYSNTYGSDNVAIGYQALYFQNFGSSTFSSNNVAVGREALYYNNPSSTSNGINNTVVGYKTGTINETGYNNTFIGYQANAGSPSLNNATSIGANAVVTYQNSLVLGDKKVWSGIGLSEVSGGPLNSFEIIARDQTTGATITGKSGLRFRQLTSGSSTSFSSNGKVLTVDGSGDVVLTQDVSSTITAQNGLYMPGGTTVYLGGTLIQGTDIDMNDHSLTFDYTTNSAGYMSIGTTTSIAKLNVGGSAALAASLNGNVEVAASFESIEEMDYNYGTKTFLENGVVSNIGSDILINSPATTEFNAGIHCNLTGSCTDYSTNYGGFFNNEIQNDDQKYTNWGVAGFASNSIDQNIGVYGEAINGRSINLGVSGVAAGADFIVGVYGKGFGTTNTWAGYFDGKVYATSGYYSSDSIFKNDIQPISNASDILTRIHGRSYTYDTDHFSDLQLPRGNQYGVIAQEVEQVLPELVETASSPNGKDSLGNTQFIRFKVVNYNGLIPILIVGHQEQKKTIDSLQNRLNTIEGTLAELISRVDNC